MVALVASATTADTEYSVQVENGRAISCTCIGHFYSHKDCRHMKSVNADIQAEIARATRFLAVKAEIEAKEASPRYSEVCGHLVRRDTARHCGCMA